jgi:hypothetical protein
MIRQCSKNAVCQQLSLNQEQVSSEVHKQPITVSFLNLDMNGGQWEDPELLYGTGGSEVERVHGPFYAQYFDGSSQGKF